MPAIDAVKYPDTVSKMLEDAAIGPLFRAHVKKNHSEEHTKFLDDTKTRRDPKKHYKLYFDYNGRYAINISSKARLPAKTLAEKEDWKSSDWKDIYTLARAEATELLDANYIDNFYSCAEFKAHHLNNLRADIKLPKKLLDELGATDKEAVTDMLVLFKADKKAGAKAAAILSKRKKTRLTPKQVVAAVGKFFRIR